MSMWQKLPVNEFKWVEDISEFNKDFIKNYNDESEEWYFLEVDVQYPKNLHNPHNYLHFLQERTKIEKVEKFVTNFHDKEDYVIYKRYLKQSLNHG